MDVYKELVAMRERGEAGALCTVVRVRGSAPQGEASKMLVRADGTLLGTVGGGCMEAEVLAKSKEVMRTGRASLETFTLTEKEMGPHGHVCGGQVEIYIEPVEPQHEALVFGCGHVGRAVAELAHKAGFRVRVFDDRDAFANRETFPFAHEVTAKPYDEILRNGGPAAGEFSYVVVVTRGHAYDEDITAWAVRTPARYVGVIGSKSKALTALKNLSARGIPEEKIRRARTPMGIDIGAVTPEEIAVSVVAEMVAVRRGVTKLARI